jgi:drug/metabolite transporter (DMT)-like permease
MEPVFAGVFSVVVGGDRLTIRTIAGAICILAAMLIAQIKAAVPGKTKKRKAVSG